VAHAIARVIDINARLSFCILWSSSDRFNEQVALVCSRHLQRYYFNICVNDDQATVDRRSGPVHWFAARHYGPT
jgi:hypothetical protein